MSGITNYGGYNAPTTTSSKSSSTGKASGTKSPKEETKNSTGISGSTVSYTPNASGASGIGGASGASGTSGARGASGASGASGARGTGGGIFDIPDIEPHEIEQAGVTSQERMKAADQLKVGEETYLSDGTVLKKTGPYSYSVRHESPGYILSQDRDALRGEFKFR